MIESKFISGRQRADGSDGPHTLSKASRGPDGDRVEALWQKLGPSDLGELDLSRLKKGFRKLDHPLKNADDMLKQIMREVDTNGDGRIQYQEFRDFVRSAEQQLFSLFNKIDRDGNGKLDKAELQSAFKNAGLTVSNRRLDSFFDDMDLNNDGYISFDEWRNFLLFMPGRENESQLRAVLSFYYAVVNVTPEGDSIGRVSRVISSAVSILILVSVLFHFLVFDLIYISFAIIVIAGSVSVIIVSIGDAAIQQCPDGPATIQVVGDGASDEHRYFLAGAIAGGVSRTATAPLDRLKVYLLVNTKSAPETALAALQHGRPVGVVRNATRPFGEAIRDLYRSGGFRGFFAGNGLNVIKIMPETAIKFGSYEAAKRALANFEGHGDPTRINPVSKFTAGGVAGMIAQFCVYPLDTLKFRLQCETVKGGLTGSALVRQTAVKMYADGGLRACYRGVTMGLVGMFPYSAIDMGMFEILKKTYRTYYAKHTGCHEDDANPGNIATGIIGASSGAFGASVVYPLNVVRTRLQTQGTVMHPATYTGIWDVTQKTIRNEGVRGLYKGLTPNLLKVAPALSITWVVYENAKRFLLLR
ncbi:Calcium-binding mitochondrial carrier SAL1 [Escovopsis weberi]|uniref:Mitochondrial thiamine pyrophosphate carrier 1 n=1 Tax=Escovopsis weberi TaxID=150374 RepID=A0A0M8N444_ESCWE|nr:Calcium-binding mitochondrial carrier SAL1 [Escovopsis weberi]